MPTLVIDPGHGGTERVGGSSPNNATGPTGLKEKDVTLALALRLAAQVEARGGHVLLTRTDDRNLGLDARAQIARQSGAAQFLSIHFNAPGVGNGTETWIHPDASAASRDFAERVQQAAVRATGLRDRGVKPGRLGVLRPSRHHASTAACLLEVSFLTHPGEETRLRTDAYLDSIARRLAEALVPSTSTAQTLTQRTERFDIWNETPLVPQLTGMSCWAAAAAMIVGWRDRIPVSAEEVASGSGHWAAYRDGLAPRDVPSLAKAWGLVLETPRAMTIPYLLELLREKGPLWVGEATPGLHSIVLSGLYGDGTPDGTFVRINDPWPEGKGARYHRTFTEFLRNSQFAAGLAGGAQTGALSGLQVLHSNGRGASRVSWRFEERTAAPS